MSEAEKDAMIEWLADTDTAERVAQIKRVVKPADLPYYLILLIGDMHEMMWWQMPDEEDEEDEAEPWKT